MCQKIHDTCIIFYSVFSHCCVLLLVLHLLKKKEWFPLVILNSDFALLNHRQITLPKYLEQITQEFFHFCLHEVASLKNFQQTWHVVHCTQTFAA